MACVETCSEGSRLCDDSKVRPSPAPPSSLCTSPAHRRSGSLMRWLDDGAEDQLPTVVA